MDEFGAMDDDWGGTENRGIKTGGGKNERIGKGLISGRYRLHGIDRQGTARKRVKKGMR